MVSARRSPNDSTPKALDRPSIEAKALSYLDRFDASASRLRAVLEQFVRRRACELTVDAGPYLAMVGETVERYEASGLVDDRRFGAAMARSLAERGTSRQTIRNKLCGRGIPPAVVDAIVAELQQESGSDLDAARTLVRKRKLGNYRPAAEQRQQYRRDLGILARAGFAVDTAKTALGVDGGEEMDDDS